MRGSRSSRSVWCAAAGILLLAAALPLCAQDDATSLTGEIVTGIAHTESGNGTTVSRTITPVGVRFNLIGYLAHPDFLSFSLSPRFTLGDQSPQAGFPAGNGGTLSATLLRRRVFPLTFRYSRFRQESVNFNTLGESNAIRTVGDYSELGMSGQTNFSRGPRFFLNYSRSDSDVESDFPVLPHRQFSGERYGVRMHDEWVGWDVNAAWRRTQDAQDNINVLDPALPAFHSSQDADTITVTGSRELWAGSSLLLSGGERDNENTVNARPFDSRSRYFRAASNMAWGEKWRADVVAGFDTNRSDILAPLIDPPLLFQTDLSTFRLGGSVSYRLHPDWNVHGGLTRTHTRTESQDPGFSSLLFGTSWGASTGLGFNRDFDWGLLSSSYGLTATFVPARTGSSSSEILGHSVQTLVRLGDVDSLEITGSGNVNLNRVKSDVFLQRESLMTSLALGRRFGNYVLRGGGGYTRLIQDNFVDIHSRGWTARASIENHAFSAFYARRISDGTTFLFAPDPANPLIPGLPIGSILSSAKVDTVGSTFNPTRELRATFRWNRIRNDFNGTGSNDSDYVDGSVVYRFRLLLLEFGYSTYDQTFGAFGSVSRNTFVVRLRRSFELF